MIAWLITCWSSGCQVLRRKKYITYAALHDPLQGALITPCRKSVFVSPERLPGLDHPHRNSLEMKATLIQNLLLRHHKIQGRPVWQALSGHKRRIPLAVVLPRPARGAGTLIPSAQRLVWAAKQRLGNAPLDCKEIQPVHSEGDQPWVFFGRCLGRPYK